MSDSQGPDKKPKPGFFSRLFTQKHIEAAEEKAAASIEEVPLPELDEPVATVAEPEAPAEARPGLLQRWFGGKDKDKPAPPPAPAAAPVEAPPKNWFDRLRDRLRSGSGSFVSAVMSAFGMSGKLDADTIERLEEILIASDVGMETALKIVKRLELRARAEKAEGQERLMELFKQVLTEVFEGQAKPFTPKATDGPYVVMVVGVNGVGKTTTIGKMAKRCKDAGLSTLLVAGDTFRAAAVEQLEVWAKRTGSEFIKGKHGADPSGLIFDALSTAKARGIDVVFVDTAGRLQTKTSLMEELAKVSRVCTKVLPDAPHETLLVIDATTGQNGIAQVKAFSAATPVSGLVMTKLDGTAKGGILITIRDQFDIPVTLIGVGEGVDDLRDFDPAQFASALFGDGKAAS